MNNKDRSNPASLDSEADTQQIDDALEQPTYDAMMRALEGKDWTNYYRLSAEWYALFKARRAQAKSFIDPNPASPQPMREGFDIQK